MKTFLKTFACVLAVGLLSCGFCFVLSACGNSHTHTFTDWAYVLGKVPTCTQDGEETRHCTSCDAVETRLAPATGHNFTNWLPTGDRTDKCNGTHFRVCSNGCGEREEGECTYTNDVHKPTCTADGYTIHRCTQCNDEFEHDIVEKLKHDFSGSATYREENGQHKHVKLCIYGCGAEQVEDCQEDITDTHVADCFSEGYNTYKCKVCNNTRTVKTQDKLTHIYESQWVPSEIAGYHEHACTLCGTKETALCEYQNTFTPATCTTDGLNHTECKTCHHVTLNETIVHEGHKYGNWQPFSGTSKTDSMHQKTCEVCGDHVEAQCTDWTMEKTDATCEAAGETVEHCKDCQVYYTTGRQEALGHNYDGAEYVFIGEDQHQQLCNNCHQPKIESCTHGQPTRTEPKCTTQGSSITECTSCKNQHVEIIEALGHTWAKEGIAAGWENITSSQHTRRCSVCHEEETSNHTYINSNLCDSCLHDGLNYKVVGDNAIVENDGNAANAKEIFVAEFYDAKPVTEIGKFAFFRSNLTKITLPKSLIIIGDSSFSSCEKLKEVRFDGIVAPTKEDLEDETRKQNLTKLTTIEYAAFTACGELVIIDLPYTLTTIGSSAFSSCNKLLNIKVPDNVLDIGDIAFTNTALVNNRQAWDGDVLYINKHLICANPDISGSYEVAKGTVNISASAFKNCTKLTEITLPAELKRVGHDAFLNCTGLNKVKFTGKFTEWLAIVFENDAASPMSVCAYLDIEGATGAIEIPTEVTSIPAGAFKGSSITSVKIHAKVTSIGEEAFENCASLATIDVDAGCNLEYVGKNAFDGTPFFENKNNWTQDGLLYVGHCLVVGSTSEKIAMSADIVVLEGTVSIAVGAFEGNKTINSIVIANSVKYIGEKAFVNSSLKKAKILMEGQPNSYWFANNAGGAGRGVSKDLFKEDEATQKALANNLVNQNIGFWRKNQTIS